MSVSPLPWYHGQFTVSDHFCGFGGSMKGLEKAGFRPHVAINHSRIAIETHAANHPEANHYCHDLQKAHPATYPYSDFAWFSPCCQNHSNAKGGRETKNLDQINETDLWNHKVVDEEAERSRATMLEVLHYTAYHRYLMVIVENVWEVRRWPPFTSWLREMEELGYHQQTLYLNSQFFGVPQSRDRMYMVFWQKWLPTPDLDFRPKATCPNCGEVNAVQAWKKTDRQFGRYGANGQYWYKCPHCTGIVIPPVTPASTVIDTSIKGELIYERKEPLVENTMRRIRAGIIKHARISDQAQQIGMTYYGRDDAHFSVEGALPTIRTANCHSLVTIPPFLTSAYGTGDGSPITLDRPIWTIPTKDRHSLVTAEWEGQRFDLEAILESSYMRFMAVNELKRGQGFGDDYILLGTEEEQKRGVGNAVVPVMAYLLADRCLRTCLMRAA